MKSSKGFGAVETILIIAVVGVIAAAGWLFFDRQKDTNDTAQKTQQTNSSSKNSEQTSTENKDAAKIDTSIHEVDIRMQTEADIDKLPDYTPSGFRTYMLGVLRDNKSYDNGEAVVIHEYSISRISQVNILGGGAPVDKEGNGYAGGAPAIWVLTPAGGWEYASLNGPACKSENGGLIYEEFVPECFASQDMDSWGKNPNGSITTIND